MTLYLLPFLLFVAVATGEATKETMPSDAAKLVETFTQEADEIQHEADARIQTRREKLIDKLQLLQDTYTKAAMLDEAVAIRDQIRALKAAALNQKKIEVLWGNRWWAAEVLQVKGNQSYIHYTGYGDNFDEWVTPDRIRPATAKSDGNNTALGAPLQSSLQYSR
jgi:hypothetical protein